MKNFLKISYLSIFIFLGFWFCQNLDFDSVFSNSIDTFRYEFSPENISQGLEALNNAFSRRTT
ncbi:MAG: hypothetical protein ACI37Z_05790 [Candidatus Gastranaerophilaceae bacterium]